MVKGLPQLIGLAPLLLVVACDHIPYYNDSLDWFSWSRYDPEVNAIEAEIPPPGGLEAGGMSGKDGMVRDPAADPAPMSGVSGHGSPVLLADGSGSLLAGTTTVATGVDTSSSLNAGGSTASAPLVGIRNSVGPSVTWRSTRGTP